MTFRANEAAQEGYEMVVDYFLSRRWLDKSQITRGKSTLENIIDECGPVVEGYPSWHPLVSRQDIHSPMIHPDHYCGYIGLDHTRYFLNGFITCPYGDGQDVIDSVNALPSNPDAYVTAKKLDVQLYVPDATPILVKCEWIRLSTNGMIPGSLAIAIFLEREIPCWRRAEFADTWETMHSYFLGLPHGKRSSLFVNQETGQKMKTIWNSLIKTGMFGPIRV